MKIKIGTRGSKLALIQTEYVKKCLEEAFPEHEYEITVIKTRGDIIQNKPLNQIGSRGLFVREIEEQILADEIQLGVHSMKDMPAQPAEGLVFSKMWKREDPRDVLILREKHSLEELPEGAVIGTGSARRGRQLRRLRPDLRIVDIRGNVDTRLRKMEEQKLDGIVLAAAGLKRLGMEDKITCFLSAEEMVPAPAQGILALEVRQNNQELCNMLDSLRDAATDLTGRTERAFLEEIGGDCHVPVGAFCGIKEGILNLRVVYGRETEEELYYAEVCGTDPEQTAKEAARSIRRRMAGTVYLVGGGPGDPGLITVRGMKLIQSADCIIYDRLSSPELLQYAGMSCEKVYVGKANHHHTMRQEDINRLLVKKSMEYEQVVRLKGGDVYVFGRGGEEALTLREAGVPFEIVPGISSAIAGPAYAGIPITHRGVSAGFHVVTAHNKNDELADIDFEAMARENDTCVFLMGLGKLGEIAGNLMKAGMNSSTGVAVISCATRPEQRTVVSDLEHIEEKVKAADIISPALIVAGQVVNLRDSLNFFEEKPLFGKYYIVPKIGQKPSRLASMLREKGAGAKEIQVGEIAAVFCEALKPDVTWDWIVFTSINGIDGFFYNLAERGLDARSLSGCKIAVIGRETGKHLGTYGIKPDFIPEKFHSDALCEELKIIFAKEERRPKVVYPCAVRTDGGLKEKLQPLCEVVEIPVYENKPVEIDREELAECGKADGILFTCGSSAERMVEALGGTLPENLSVVSIGKKCSEKLRELGVKEIIQAKQAVYGSMVEALLCQKNFYNPDKRVVL